MTTSCCSVSNLLEEKLGKVTMGFGDSLLNSAGQDLYCIRRLTLFESFNFFSSPKVCAISEMVRFIHLLAF